MICFKMSIYRKILIGFTSGLLGYIVTRWLLSRKEPQVVVIQETSSFPEDITISEIGTTPTMPGSKECKQPADDLLVIEGIGPKIKSVLQNAGITSFSSLAAADPEKIKEILKSGGIRITRSETWQEQAGLAAGGKWEALKYFQGKIKGGKVVKP